MPKKTEQKKTHTINQVDAYTARATVDGFAECYDVVADTQKQMLDAINVVMGIYMTQELGKYQSRVEELDLIYTVIQSFGEKFDENYFEKLDELKDFAETEEAKLDYDNY